ncbi:hypothetical protein R3J22_05300 [Trueperella bernardiae]|nr:hypothetical protein [Trueperella bernardiae]MDV6238944.1 hypothetical protein [Trueperella bernardiae]
MASPAGRRLWVCDALAVMMIVAGNRLPDHSMKLRKRSIGPVLGVGGG